jgi:hypothetical protein
VSFCREWIVRLHVRVLNEVIEVTLVPLGVSVGRVAWRNTQPDAFRTWSTDAIHLASCRW